MSAEVLVTAACSDESLTNVPVGTRVFGSVKLTDADDAHQFGQWSAVLTRTGIEGAPGPGVFRLAFMSSDAPVDSLERGAQLEFYRAPVHLATLQLIARPRASSLVDRDIVLMPSAPARDANAPVAA